MHDRWVPLQELITFLDMNPSAFTFEHAPEPHNMMMPQQHDQYNSRGSLTRSISYLLLQHSLSSYFVATFHILYSM